MIESAESALPKCSSSMISKAMFSNGASLVQSMLVYANHQELMNDMWMDAYLKLLRRHYRVASS